MEITLAMSEFFLEIQGSTAIENVLKIFVGAFSLLLLAISISAYRRTGFKKIVYAIVAFALFGIQALFDFLADKVNFLGSAYNDVILVIMTLAILVLFFLAVDKRN